METTATTKGQVAIHSAVRRKLGIKTGTRFNVEVNEENTQIILRRSRANISRAWPGSFVVCRSWRIWSESVGRDREREDRKFDNVLEK